MEKEFPKDQDVQIPVRTFAPVLAEAVGRGSLPIGNGELYKGDHKTEEATTEVVEPCAGHRGIGRIQEIFREKANGMCHWGNDPNIFAESKFTRPDPCGLVTGSKVSLSSPRDGGVRAGEMLMRVLLTVKRRLDDVQTRFEQALTNSPTIFASSTTSSP